VVALDSKKHDWNIYYSRLFCGEENFRGLCKECHDKKSKKENEQRRLLKK
jgi:5-methylcytosine-specific restriction endonuclease McrA